MKGTVYCIFCFCHGRLAKKLHFLRVIFVIVCGFFNFQFLFADLGSARESSSVTQRNSDCSKIGLPGCHNARFVVFKLGG